jgi:hypothetical protein
MLVLCGCGCRSCGVHHRPRLEFAEEVSITYVMGGLAQEFRKPVETIRHVLGAARRVHGHDHVHGVYDTTDPAELRAAAVAGATAARRDGRAMDYCLSDVKLRSWVV